MNTVNVMIAMFIDTQIVIIAISPNMLSLPFLLDYCKWLHILEIGGAADLMTVMLSYIATRVPADIFLLSGVDPAELLKISSIFD